MPTGTTACLGPSELARCPHGALAPPAARRCAPCAAVWAATHTRRPYDHLDRLDNEAILDAWRAIAGPRCPGCPISGGRPHTVDETTNPLTVDHTPSVAIADQLGLELDSLGKRVRCRAGNAALGAHL